MTLVIEYPLADPLYGFFAKLLSGAASYIGFIMIAFMDRKRGLHDVIARTQVLRY